MTCERSSEIIGIGTVESVDTKEPTGPVSGVVDMLLPTNRPTTQKTTPILSYNTTIATSTPTTPSTTQYRRTETTTISTTTITPTTSRPTVARTGNVVVVRTTPSSLKHNQDLGAMQQHQPRPPLVLGSPLYKSKSSEKDIIVKDVLRQDNAVIIYWDTEVANILGFRVIYRLFGDTSFKQAPPLEATEREFKIKNVPSQVRQFFFCIRFCFRDFKIFDKFRVSKSRVFFKSHWQFSIVPGVI